MCLAKIKKIGENNLSLVCLDNQVFIGSGDICDLREEKSFGEMPTIHIFRDDKLDNNCIYVNGILAKGPYNENKHFCLEYKDGYCIPDTDLNNLYRFIKSKAQILVHCHAGRTRSAVIGLFAFMLLDKSDPISALEKVYRNFYTQLGYFPNITLDPMTSIMSWYENRKNDLN